MAPERSFGPIGPTVMRQSCVSPALNVVGPTAGVLGPTSRVPAVRVRLGRPADISGPARNSSSLHFLITADWGGLPLWPWVTPAQRKVAAAMGRVAKARGSAFALSLGDHFYFHGVRSANDPRFRRTFERAFSAAALQGASFWRIAAGNHDHAGNITAQERVQSMG